LETR